MTDYQSIAPQILMVRVLEACNAGCFMCIFARSNDDFRFSITDAEDLAAFLMDSSYIMVRFTGGEPLLMDKIDQIIKVIKASDVKTSLITNGWHLKDKANTLLASGLDQVIVSLDGCLSETHDKYRKSKGLFNKAIAGIREIRKLSNLTAIRVNTVVGPHNYAELLDIHSLLIDLEVNHWSIIPIKGKGNVWKNCDIASFEEFKCLFQKKIEACSSPKLIGESANWFGRTTIEQRRLFQQGIPFTPKDKCDLVNIVRYYSPRDGMVYPCNCIPHRVGSIQLGQPIKNGSLLPDGLQEIRAWLADNGPSFCTGCEPANVSLGECKVKIEDDLFAF